MGEIIFWDGRKYDCSDKRVKKVRWAIGGKINTPEKYVVVYLEMKDGTKHKFTSNFEGKNNVHHASKSSIEQAEQYLQSLPK